MLKELIGLITAFINSDDDDLMKIKICINDKKELEIKLSDISFNNKEQSTATNTAPIDVLPPTEKEILKDNPIISSTTVLQNSGADEADKQRENTNTIWPHGKKPSLDLESFKIALTQYIAEHPKEKQREIGKAFGLDTSSINVYIKRFFIPYGLKVKKTKKTPQKTIIEHNQQNTTQDNKEVNNCDMPNHLKKELHEMVRNAVLNINMAQAEALALKSKLDNFGENGNLITSNLGTWNLKPLNGSGDSHLEFTGLATSAQYQLFPRWEIGKSYCILQFYGNIKTVEYVVSVHNGQIRVNRRS